MNFTSSPYLESRKDMVCSHVQRSSLTSPLLPSQGAKIFLKIIKEITVSFVTNAAGHGMEPARRSPHEFCPLFLAGGITACSAPLEASNVIHREAVRALVAEKLLPL